jgi:enamine deaminase RidA (YjgF/YER057c/UK114 family)
MQHCLQAIKHGETLYISGQVPLVPGVSVLCCSVTVNMVALQGCLYYPAWAYMAMCRHQCLALLQTKNLIGDDIEAQTDQALKNLGAILEAAGSSYSQVLKTTVLLTDMGDFAKVNGVYGELFHREQGPELVLCPRPSTQLM